MVPWDCLTLQFVIMVFLDHTHLLYWQNDLVLLADKDT